MIDLLILKGMDDGVDNIREASAEAMGNLMKVVSEKALHPFIEKLDKIKEAKVKDFYQNANTRPGVIQAAPVVIKKSPKGNSKQQLSVMFFFKILESAKG